MKLTLNRWMRSKRASETQALGRVLGQRLAKRSVLMMQGEIGSGKTTFTKGIACGLGLEVDVSEVVSPTFVLVHEYPCRVPLFHIDLYRLPTLGAHDRELIADYMDREGVTVIEWSERASSLLPQDYLLIEFRHVSESSRQIRLTPKGEFKWPE